MSEPSRNPDSVPGPVQIPRDLLVADFGAEGALAFRLSDRVPKILNPSAAVVFAALRRGAAIEEAARELQEKFGIDLHTAANDVKALVNDLMKEGLLGLGKEPAGIPPLPEDRLKMLEATMAEPERTEGQESPPPPDIPEKAVPFRTDKDVILREEEEGAFLFEPETGELSCLNPVGILVWKALDGKKPLDVIVDEILGSFEGVDRETVQLDVRAFLGELKSFGFADWNP